MTSATRITLGTRFSKRHDYRGPEHEISAREDAPENLRFAIPQIAEDIGMTPTPLRRVVCRVLRVRPDPMNWTEHPNVSDEVNDLIAECPWFKVYDIAEALHATLAPRFPDRAEAFEEQLNDVFLEKGIGWQMTDGEIVYRGSDAFAETTRLADEILADTGHLRGRKRNPRGIARYLAEAGSGRDRRNPTRDVRPRMHRPRGDRQTQSHAWPSRPASRPDPAS